MSTVKCLASEATIESIDEAFNELDHLRGIFQALADNLTDETHWQERGAGEATGAIMDQGMLLALANERLERLIDAGQTIANRRAHAGQEG